MNENVQTKCINIWNIIDLVFKLNTCGNSVMYLCVCVGGMDLSSINVYDGVWCGFEYVICMLITPIGATKVQILGTLKLCNAHRRTFFTLFLVFYYCE